MRSLTAVAVLAVLLVFALPLPFGNAAAADVYTVEGRVVSGYGEFGPELPDDAGTVTISLICGDDVYDATADEDGCYSVDVEEGVYSIKVTSDSETGYGFLLMPDDPSKISRIGGKDVLTVNSDITVNVAMVRAVEKITGNVMHNGNVARNVLIEVTNSNGNVIGSDKTDLYGNYTIECVPGYDYTVSVNNQYFKKTSQHLDGLALGTPVTIDFDVELRDSEEYLFGLDLTHSLMVLGGITGLFLLIFIVFYRIHIGKHPESSKVHSDSKKKDQD